MGLEFLKKHLNLVLTAIIVLMGIEILYLVLQNRRLAAIVRDPKQVFQTLHSGDVVPSIRTVDLDGDELSLRYGPEEPHTLIFWFSPTCSSCEDNLDFWNELYSQYLSEKVRFLGICACKPDEAREITEGYGIEFSVICATDPFIVETYKGNVLPQTVLVAPDGSIGEIWPGSLLEGQKNEILAALTGLN